MVQVHAPIGGMPPGSSAPWSEYVGRSGFFVIAVLLHLVVLFFVATIVVFPGFHPPPDTPIISYFPLPPPPPPAPPATSGQTVAVSPLLVSPTTPIISPSPSPKFVVPIPSIPPTDASLGVTPQPVLPIKVSPNSMPAKRVEEIKHTVLTWRSPDNIYYSGDDTHNLVAHFPVYLAKYADGDWACNTILRDNKIVGGSLMNLVEKINQWSHGNITGTVMPQPLDITSPELIAKPPPFLFFTGHKDFHLTDAEIQNLRDYLEIGGCIWGDSAFAGQGSRFDVAFHREMKRVVPDLDKNFETTDLNHDIFAKGWYPIAKLPTGMNYYAEPVQHLDIDGKLAILYTPNDYADMFTMRILPGDQQMAPDWVPMDATDFLQTDSTFLHNSQIFFRNYTLPSCLACHQLGMNVIGYLLIRFDKDIVLSPP
jgi:hypothetical protein